MNVRFILILLAFILVAPTQAQSPLDLNLERFLITEYFQEGEMVEVLEPALALEPGETIQERLTVTNISGATLNKLSLEVPVPVGTRYLGDTASTLILLGEIVNPEFSFDGGATYGFPPLMQTVVVVENGVSVEKEVEVIPEAYTHVRWLLPTLHKEAGITTSFRAMVR